MLADITQTALHTFNENLLFLREKHPKLYERINLLNQLIDEQKYTERYALEYTQDSYFDVLELASNEFLYKENSLLHAQRMIELIDLKRQGAIFKGQRFIQASEQQAELIDKSKLSFHNALWATIKIINYVSSHASGQTHMNQVNKIIFLDIGLGLHLEGIIDKLNPKVVFIKEKNLETFRLSLFATNYKKILEERISYFSLSNSPIEERKSFIEFLDRGNNYNLHMKHIPFTQDYGLQLQRLQSHVLSQSYINYGYSSLLLRFIDSPRYLVQGYSFLNVNTRHHDNILSQKPLLLLFSGPSTSHNLQWIKENHERFIIASALSTCKLLNEVNISPDIVVHIDPGENSAKLFEGLEIDKYFKNTSIILASNVDEATVKKFEPSNIHFVEQGSLYKKGFGKLSAPSVGEYTYALSLILGAVEVFILGIDLALDNETLQTHGDFHQDQIKGKVNNETSSLDIKSSVEYTQGNFLEQVPTLATYKLSIDQFEIFTKMLKHDYHNIYNLGNGARLEGANPLKINSFKWDKYEPLDKVKIQESLKQLFYKIGESHFNDEDKGVIKYQIQKAKKLEKLIKQYKKKKYVNAQVYLNAIAQLAWDLSDMQKKTNSDLAQVYYEYFPIILSYIFDLFNTKELTQEKKHISNINYILVSQLLKISTLYISRLEEYLIKDYVTIT